jgi:hypothetical protein
MYYGNLKIDALVSAVSRCGFATLISTINFLIVGELEEKIKMV